MAELSYKSAAAVAAAAAAAAVSAATSIKDTLAYSVGAVTEISLCMGFMGVAAVVAGASVSLAVTDRHLLPAVCAVAASGVAIALHRRAVAVATSLDDVFETTVALVEQAATEANIASALAAAVDHSLADTNADASADTDDEMVDASGV